MGDKAIKVSAKKLKKYLRLLADKNSLKKETFFLFKISSWTHIPMALVIIITNKKKKMTVKFVAILLLIK